MSAVQCLYLGRAGLQVSKPPMRNVQTGPQSVLSTPTVLDSVITANGPRQKTKRLSNASILFAMQLLVHRQSPIVPSASKGIDT